MHLITDQTTAPSVRSDPLERLGVALLDRLGPAWVPDTRRGESAVTLLHVASGRRVGADPRERRIVLQAWTRHARHVTPTAVYAPEFTGHEDLAHWLSCGDLTNASAAMATTLTQLLAQLPETGDHLAIEEDLADQASELVEQTRAFAAGLIQRQPAAAGAREIYRLAARLTETATAVDERRGQ